MALPRVLILRAPGTNCDQETAFAFSLAGAQPETLHVNRLLENPRQFAHYQILCIPGGFSYGDDLGAGRILASQMRGHLVRELEQFKADGKLILGICNGFQVLVRSGVLLADQPGGPGQDPTPAATLTLNDCGRFQDRWVQLQVTSSRCVFFSGIERMYLPVAHAEGKFVSRDAALLAQLRSADQIALRYQSLDGGAPAAGRYPDNPNGAVDDVAAVCDETGRVCGLMPHPERYVDRTQHPRWTRGEGRDPGGGLRVFQNAVAYFR
ncbi:MAG TPA: phosphoribosylformylglycinamidine synthase I [Pirellulales bacterium]